ncbi:MAG: phosphoenolpyruvate synthase [Pseudonocardia sp.]|nr:phosphoenolpyruvate synthase [Pseudonocardia sp.]
MTRSHHQLVLPLAALGRDDLAVAGGKGANLGELVRAGLPVPDAVVVSTDAYAAVVQGAGLAATIEAGLLAADGGAGIRAAFAAVTVPDGLRAKILAAYAELGGGPVAVRSSATAEDLPGAAFAGQQDTYLNIVGDVALVDAVRRCWGSLWTERAIAYRDRRDVDQATVRIAVVVQRMVPAEHAGVMFTVNPVTGARDEIVIDASSGLGEAVVSGLVTPDHYVLDASGSVVQRTPGRREVVIRGIDGGGVAHTGDEPVDPLPDTVLVELAELGRAVTAHFGRPQDIEWARADGRVWLVQARPMTALPPAPQRLNPIQRRIGRQHLDYFHTRPYPMDMSAWILPGIGRMVERMLGEIVGLRVRISDVLPEIDGVVDRYVPPLPSPTRAMLAAPARAAHRIRRFTPADWERDPRFIRFRRQVRELDATDLAALGWSDLIGVARHALAVMDLIGDLRVDYLPRTAFDLVRLHAMARVLRLRDLTLGTRTRTEDANRGLEHLAALVRGDPELSAAFAERDGAALLDRVDGDGRADGGGPGRVRQHARFVAALREFLAEYGHRETTSPLLMSAPTWGDAPDTGLARVAVLAGGPPRPPAPDLAAAADERLAAHPIVRRLGAAAAAGRVVAVARAGIAFREDTHFHATAVMPVLRRVALEAGERLAAAGVLPVPDDAFHLRLEELESAADPAGIGPGDAERLRSMVRARSARRDELAGVPMINTADLFPPPPAGSDALVRGVPASAGRVTGPVRVVGGPESFGTLRDGEVLVCPYTNPAWTPLFQRAGAVVVDSGGVGSHAAIVAREYGIPAVMGTGTGTAVLSDGLLVTVDGNAGLVLDG